MWPTLASMEGLKSMAVMCPVWLTVSAAMRVTLPVLHQ